MLEIMHTHTNRQKQYSKEQKWNPSIINHDEGNHLKYDNWCCLHVHVFILMQEYELCQEGKTCKSGTTIQAV